MKGSVIMGISFKNYDGKSGFTDNYEKVRKFLIEINENKIVSSNFLWSRWEWMHSLTRYMDVKSLHNIGLWMEGDKIVGLATYELELGYGYFILDPSYEYLKSDMLSYAKKSFAKDGKFKALINDTDREFQKIALTQGFYPTEEYEKTAIIDISDEISYELPRGFSIHSLEDGFNEYRLNRCKYRGFNNGEEMPEGESTEMNEEYLGPNLNKNIHIYLTAPDGEYVSYCGSWYDKITGYAYIEPVCTDPLYRKMGCGKAVVLEAVKRCGLLGAKHAFVISSQQFYYNIGFYPYSNNTWWSAK